MFRNVIQGKAKVEICSFVVMCEVTLSTIFVIAVYDVDERLAHIRQAGYTQRQLKLRFFSYDGFPACPILTLG